MKIKNTEIKLVQGDVTKQKADAIVVAADNNMRMNAGTVSHDSGKKLPAKYVIYAQTRLEGHKSDEQAVRGACRKALRLADKLKARSVAISALGQEAGFPLKASAKILAQEVLRHFNDGESQIKELFLCAGDKESFKALNQDVFGYLDYILNKLKCPFLTVDAIIDVRDGIVIIQRSNPPFGFALPGGFVDYGESLEDAVIREAKEETGLDLRDLRQFHTYSAVDRDPRFHTVTTVYVAHGEGKLKAGDDASSARVVPLREIESLEFAFNHKFVLRDYMKYIAGIDPF